MNRLSIEKKAQIVTLLVEGNSLRSCSRIADVSINTVTKLLVEVGTACWDFHNANVVNVKSQRIQCDEIWAFIYSKEKSKPNNINDYEAAGDCWTWTGLDPDTKLMVSYGIGNRDADSANFFMQDVASRMANRIQLTTDGLHSYLEAVTDNFGSQIDFAQLVKIYGKEGDGGNATERKYSPSRFKSAKKTVISGTPDEDHISTSHVERSNLTMRMHMRRFTRLTNGFSKKWENHFYAISLHFMYYNWVKLHKTLRCTPAMAAGLTKRFMSIEDIVRLIPEPIAQKRGSYKPRSTKELISN